MNWLVLLLSVMFIPAIIIVTRNVLSRFKIWTPKRVFTFIGVYIGVGVISFIGLAIMSDNHTKILSEEKVRQVQEEYVEMQTFVENNDLEKINPDYLKKQRSYVLPTNELTVYIDEKSYSTKVYVTWRDDPESNEILADSYLFPHIVSGIDVSSEVPLIGSTFDDSALYVKEDGIELKYYSLYSKIQILDNYYENHYINIWPKSSSNFNSLVGQQMLHLNVPKHINIIDNSGLISYLYN
ncbi:hypothetical protein [Solibacillus sp. FSL H8-0538]|uniref:hypothetical protein n=1 Tax=Solibacillus sp. FSL H8-0538 TaxID=2921400 RepID=UPI0030F82C04